MAKLSSVVVGILSFTFLGTLGIVAYVTVNGGDVAPITALVTTAIGAAIPGVLNYNKMNKIENQTNGTLSTLSNRNATLEAINSELMRQLGQKEGTNDA